MSGMDRAGLKLSAEAQGGLMVGIDYNDNPEDLSGIAQVGMRVYVPGLVEGIDNAQSVFEAGVRGVSAQAAQTAEGLRSYESDAFREGMTVFSLADRFASYVEGWGADFEAGVAGLWAPISRNDSLAEKTHFGPFQSWHSMTDDPTQSLARTRAGHLATLNEWYKEAISYPANDPRAMFWMGRIIHTLQDSYSGAHVLRGPDMSIVGYYNYNDQIAGAHRGWDAGMDESTREMTVRSAEYALKMYERGFTPAEFTSFVRDHIYTIRPQDLQRTSVDIPFNVYNPNARTGFVLPEHLDPRRP